jgi:glucose/arabinose dehydrogenase
MKRALLAILCLASCQSVMESQSSAIELVSAANPSGTVGAALTEPIQVRLVRNRQPVSGVSATFSLTSGHVEFTEVETNEEGLASAGRWTLGTVAGAHVLTVSAPGFRTLALSATALPGVGIQTEAFAGDGQIADVGTAVPIAPAQRITDTHGNPVSGLNVFWEIIEGNGSLVGPAEVPTNGDGVSRVQGWILGPTPGQNRITARMPGLPTTTFVAQGLSNGPSMVVERGDWQTAPVNSDLPLSLAVRLRDENRDPRANVTVTFSVTSGGGTLTGTTAVSDSNGIATLGGWRLGPSAGQQSVTASAANLPSVVFRATALGTGAPQITRTVHLENLAQPWDIAFAPDGTMVFTERRGDIRVLRPGATAAQLLHRPADVDAQGQSGMMGVALDPSFISSRRLYVYFSARSNNVVDNRIVRFRVADDWIGLTNREDLLTGIAWGNGGAHSGGRLRFGHDGHLYLTTGDNRTFSIPQDPNSLGGKVLRIDKTGSIPPGNMPSPFRPSVFAFGFRNPQGIAFRPQTTQVFLCEHGPGNDDEVTLLVAGGNGGWDPRNPNDANDTTYFGYMGTSMTDVTKFPTALPPTWKDTSSGGMSGCGFLNGAQWRDWNGALAVASLADRTLRILRLNAEGTDVLAAPEAVFGGQERLRAVVQGPDGALYVSTDGRPGGDQIWRVTGQ